MTGTKKFIDKEIAFLGFFKMGPSRNMAALFRQLRDQHGSRAPCYNTLKAWSKEGEWKERIKREDKVVLDKVTEEIMPVIVAERADMILSVHTINTDIDRLMAGIYTLDSQGKIVMDEHGHPILKIFVEDVRDLERLMSVRLKAIETELKLRGESIKQELEITGIEFVPAKYEQESPAILTQPK